MKVAGILQTKGGDCVTILPSASLADASKALSEHGIGALVVADGKGTVRGILSERDIVRKIAEKGPLALEMVISSVMTAEVVTITRDETVQDAMAKMSGRRIRHLPVVEEGSLNGMISIGDVVKHRIEEVESEASTLRAYIAS
ncbi:MAG: CBS domain-containing protein [Pseudomonadota bacterium]